ncbi:hypothetical protein GTS_57360 [Gandjariella thermophila]|uniref:Uncharacterized protein n=1 Tax=Gandjariella thermophila TaxID=1931992 RepID=A0A4D4JJL8_9PSEU|nr:hypothetical protein GTS_57360 [Gandjariella thermophila]
MGASPAHRPPATVHPSRISQASGHRGGTPLAAEELWGWPVDVLDRLLELRQQAWKGAIPLEEWREGDAALRAGQPAVDKDEVEEFQQELMVNGPADLPREESGRLVGRLTALANRAPSDEQLWEELATVAKVLADRKRSSRLAATYHAARERIVTWLTRPGGGIDPVTGLPWSQIARYRIVDDPDLGRVPQYVDAARQLAKADASDEERARAEMLVETTRWQQIAGPMAELNQRYLTWFPRLILSDLWSRASSHLCQV